jgi:hypothetical protein
MGDPFLNYFALFLLLFVVVVIFYGIIAIHDIPYMIAEARHHPHQDAIYAAGWVSLFTLHALWPFLWIWAMAYRPERGWGFSSGSATSPPDAASELESLRRRVEMLERAREMDAAGGRQAADEPPPGSERRDAAIEPTSAAPRPADVERTGGG